MKLIFRTGKRPPAEFQEKLKYVGRILKLKKIIYDDFGGSERYTFFKKKEAVEIRVSGNNLDGGYANFSVVDIVGEGQGKGCEAE